MTGLFANGVVLDLILGAMAVEGLGLTLRHALTGRGIAPKDFLANLLSGMCVLLGMRLAIGGAWWGFVSGSLLGALAFHVVDLHRRWP
jgi:hypothetical protein